MPEVNTWIALLRGVNVGGKNLLPMAALRRDLEAVGLVNVRTYIQSGNVVFDARAARPEDLALAIAERVESQHGFRPQVLVLDREELVAAVAANPFHEADPKTLHFSFLAQPAADPDIAALTMLKRTANAIG